MSKLKIFYSVAGIGFGIFMFIFGGYDDSPGAQLLGVLFAAGGVYGLVKRKN